MILQSRYPDVTHELEEVSPYEYIAKDYNRICFDHYDEETKAYVDIYAIDFEGGPFLRIGDTCFWDNTKTIKEFKPNNKIKSYLNIILEDNGSKRMAK